MVECMRSGHDHVNYEDKVKGTDRILGVRVMHRCVVKVVVLQPIKPWPYLILSQAKPWQPLRLSTVLYSLYGTSSKISHA